MLLRAIPLVLLAGMPSIALAMPVRLGFVGQLLSTDSSDIEHSDWISGVIEFEGSSSGESEFLGIEAVTSLTHFSLRARFGEFTVDEGLFGLMSWVFAERFYGSDNDYSNALQFAFSLGHGQFWNLGPTEWDSDWDCPACLPDLSFGDRITDPRYLAEFLPIAKRNIYRSIIDLCVDVADGFAESLPSSPKGAYESATVTFYWHDEGYSTDRLRPIVYQLTSLKVVPEPSASTVAMTVLLFLPHRRFL